MKQVMLFLSLLFIGGAFGDSTPTSVGYVDSQIGALQNKIGAVDTNTVLTHTNTAGEIGQKSIYDATGNYAEQQNALVPAEVANAAVQNAIDSEFVCTEWAPNAEQIDENCYIWNIKNAVNQSKNLFDPSQLLQAEGWTENNGVYTGKATSMFNATNGNGARPFSEGLFKPNTQYTLSLTLSAASGTGLQRARMYFVYIDGSQWNINPNLYVAAGQTKHVVWTSTAGKTVQGLQFTYGESDGQVSISNIQVEEGTVATAYQPYGENTYLPSGN